ncbi:uncharacterized protein BDV17DRAFT_176698 [Aspergillus undulatus]|uniref:uncharacterized protein n=1 Tax=Aspergillus undulatus TaxID=1810928 RepID=UPI003CCCA36E
MKWYFPLDRPELTIMRLSFTFICYMAADTFLISPLRIPSVILRSNIEDMIIDFEESYLDMQGDVNHLSGIALFASVVSVIVLFWLILEAVPSTIALRRLTAVPASIPMGGYQSAEVNQAAFSMISHVEADFQNKIRDCRNTILNIEAHRDRERAAAKAATKRAEELKTMLEDESARRIATEKGQSEASAKQRTLRERLVVMDTQLHGSRATYKNTATEHESDIKGLKKTNRRASR